MRRIEELVEEVPREENDRNQAVWKVKCINNYKFIDDGTSCAKVCFDSCVREMREEEHRRKHAVSIQNCFRSITEAGTFKAMVVNTVKLIFCAYLTLEDSKETCTVLGFRFGPRPSPVYHVLKIRTVGRSGLSTWKYQFSYDH